MKKVGIKTEAYSRILIRAAMMSGELEGVISDLGKGHFVVTEECADELRRFKVKFTEVEIVSPYHRVLSER